MKRDANWIEASAPWEQAQARESLIPAPPQSISSGNPPEPVGCNERSELHRAMESSFAGMAGVFSRGVDRRNTLCYFALRFYDSAETEPVGCNEPSELHQAMESSFAGMAGVFSCGADRRNTLRYCALRARASSRIANSGALQSISAAMSARRDRSPRTSEANQDLSRNT